MLFALSLAAAVIKNNFELQLRAWEYFTAIGDSKQAYDALAFYSRQELLQLNYCIDYNDMDCLQRVMQRHEQELIISEFLNHLTPLENDSFYSYITPKQLDQFYLDLGGSFIKTEQLCAEIQSIHSLSSHSISVKQLTNKHHQLTRELNAAHREQQRLLKQHHVKGPLQYAIEETWNQSFDFTGKQHKPRQSFLTRFATNFKKYIKLIKSV